MSDDNLVFVALGGAGEIGMNLNLYGFGPEGSEKWLMVDLGVTFSDGTVPGVDLIMPDPAFIGERRQDLLALVLTHGHEDHIGAVPWLWPRLQCPVYATPFTAELLRGKLAEAGLLETVPLTVVDLSSRFTIGPFDLELVSLTHSIPEPNAVAIRTGLGTVMHTGDWKIDPDPLLGEKADKDRLDEIGEEGVLAIVCDSTNVFTPGESGSEADVRESLGRLVAQCNNRVAVTTFASNVARLESVARVALENGRHPVLVGRSMHKMVAAARASGYLTDLPEFVDDEDAGYLPRDRVLLICTGSQGEPRAALSRIAEDTHPTISLEEGDTVIFSSKIIPGNEVAIYGLQNTLTARGIEIITEKDDFVHVSGHPCRDELAEMYRMVRPEISVPVHGELRHLVEHADLARSLQVGSAFVAPNGTMLRLAPGPASISDHVPTGRLYQDGRVLVDESDEGVRERRRLGFAGAVFIALTMDGKGRTIAAPDVRILGLPEEDADGVAFEDRVLDEIDLALERLKRTHWRDPDAISEFVRRAVRGHLRRIWDKKPAVEVSVTIVGR